MVRNDKIKLLSINGVFPSKETILNETYFYTDVFYAITTDTKNENVNAFIDWILSEQGQYLVDKTGYVSIK
jgi:phosphate transport system substrate-binding protein